MIPEPYLAMLVGAGIAIGSSLLTTLTSHILIQRREERKHKAEIKQKRIDAAHEFYRGLYNSVKPFLKAYSTVTFGSAMLSLISMARKGGFEYEDVKDINFSRIIQELSDAMNKLMEEGYAALFPQELFGSIFRLFLQTGKCNSILKEKALHELNKEEWADMTELIKQAEDVRNKIRRLLNVDALTLE